MTDYFLQFVSVVSVLTISAAIPAKFRAAVYEHVVISPTNPEKNFTREEAFMWMSKNLDVFEEQIQKAKKMAVQIIVFPEYGITGFDHSRDSIVPFLEDIPDEKAQWNPCTEPARYPDTRVLNKVSCLAKLNEMYIVVNMGDIKKCDTKPGTSCPADGRYQFNTNVVFNSSGSLVARYHKYNMYDETPLFDPAPQPEYTIFETPFGKFGTTVCFDLLHYYPTQVLIEIMGINNLLVTSAWDVFYPFVLPIQMYAGLAKRNSINVIASNVRSMNYSMASSGIFGHGVDEHSDPNFYSDQGELVIADVLNTSGGKHNRKSLTPVVQPRMHSDDVMTQHSGVYAYGMKMTFTTLLDDSNYTSVCLKQADLCCSIEYQFKYHDPNEVFILAVSDFKMERPGKIHMQFCAVNRCASPDLATCGGVTTFSTSTFSYIKIQSKLNNSLLYPFVSTSPYHNITYNLEMENYSFDKDHGILESDSLDGPLLAAVIFNSVDMEEAHESSPPIGESSVGSKPTSCAFVFVMMCYLGTWILV